MSSHAQADVSKAAFAKIKAATEAQNRNDGHPPVYKRCYKIQESVDYSGHSRSVLYEANKRGDLIFTKFGGATRIENCDLDAYLDATGVKVEAA